MESCGMESTAATSPRRCRFPFVGDGLYCGDGGAELQRVWELHRWKPLGGCDGRFVHRGSSLARLSLPALVREWQVASCTSVVRCCEVDESMDAADVVRFVGGGGMITYVKSDGAFVHTLNTESGLARKLKARGGHAHLVYALGDAPAAPIFAALVALVAHVPEPQRTSAAPALAVALRAHLARAAVRTAALPEQPAETARSGAPAPILAALADAARQAPAQPAPAQPAPAQPATVDECAPCEDAATEQEAPPPTPPRTPPPTPPPARPRRSVDFLLQGTSIVTNRHLARFAAAPYLPYLLHEPAFTSMLSRSSKILRKELIEAYAPHST
jgi:hypothetical protein